MQPTIVKSLVLKNNHLTVAPIIQRLPSAVQRTLGFLTIIMAQKAAILLKRTKPRRRIALRRGSFMSLNSRKPYFKRFLGVEKVHRNSIKITVDLWWSIGGSTGCRAGACSLLPRRRIWTASDRSLLKASPAPFATLAPSRVRAQHILQQKRKGSTEPFLCSWWSIGGSNPWPLDCQSNALPAALMPQA